MTEQWKQEHRKVWYYNPITGVLQQRTAYHIGTSHDRQGNVNGEEWYLKDQGEDKPGMTGTLDVDWLFTTKEKAVRWGMEHHQRTINEALAKLFALGAM